MALIRFASASLLAALVLAAGTAAGRDDKNKDLPPLPPPAKPGAKAAEKPKAAEPAANVNRVPVEITVSLADLEKQFLRSLVQKLDPKADPQAEPKLPLVVAGNEKDFVPGAADGALAQRPVIDAAREFRENLKEMRATRPRLLPGRQPVMRPVRDRAFVRPGVLLGTAVAQVGAGMIGSAVGQLGDLALGALGGKVDLAYRVELRSFSLSVSGNTLTCEVGGGFHAEGKAPAPGPAPVPPPNVRDLSVKMIVTKELVWGESGKLELKGGSTRVWIDPGAPIVGFPRLDIERVLRLNGILGMLSGVLDRELMKRLPADGLPDLAAVAPKLNEKLPFLALSEITAYPLRGDAKQMTVPLVVGLVPAGQKPAEVKITAKDGPAPEAKIRGRIVFDKDGKPDVKLDAKP